MAVPPLLGDNHALLFVLLRRGCLYVLVAGVAERLVSLGNAGHFLYPLWRTGVDDLHFLYTLFASSILCVKVYGSFTYA